ncbi:hypothetical protein MMA231_01908 [Asticcacaulis sp. MM231]|uniref:hypothetical protein n=1 Tax=Asticcacaulis sp. MM231 TaxID=3157666 RepID=UPI0032D56C92
MAVSVWQTVSAMVLALGMICAPGAEAQGIDDLSGPVVHADLYARVKVAGFSAPVDLRQSGQKTRVDVTSGGILQTYIADRDKGVLISMTATGQNRMALVFPLDHAEGVIPLPLELPVLVRQATVKPVGASIVGGRPCRVMEFSGYLNQSGIICVSLDNIILQMTKQGRREPLFQVIELTVGRQEAKWFRTPPEYQVAVVPGIGGASASGSGGLIEQPMPPPVAKPKAALGIRP